MHKFTLLESEHHKSTYRQSQLFIFKPLLIALIIIFVPLYFLWQYGLLSQLSSVVFVLALGAGLWFLRELIIWYKNCYVLTNFRLILFSHDGLFKRTVIETPLERVLNVSYKTTGMISALFDYGDVEVQVVGLVEPVILKHIPEPATIKDYLWEMHKRVATRPISFQAGDISHYQESVGYTKKNQKVL